MSPGQVVQDTARPLLALGLLPLLVVLTMRGVVHPDTKVTQITGMLIRQSSPLVVDRLVGSTASQQLVRVGGHYPLASQRVGVGASQWDTSIGLATVGS